MAVRCELGTVPPVRRVGEGSEGGGGEVRREG